MEKQELQETNTPDLSNIEFLNQAEKNKQVYIFKSIEDAEETIKDEEFDKEEASIVVINYDNADKDVYLTANEVIELEN